jgi:hypothetical protein
MLCCVCMCMCKFVCMCIRVCVTACVSFRFRRVETFGNIFSHPGDEQEPKTADPTLTVSELGVVLDLADVSSFDGRYTSSFVVFVMGQCFAPTQRVSPWCMFLTSAPHGDSWFFFVVASRAYCIYTLLPVSFPLVSSMHVVLCPFCNGVICENCVCVCVSVCRVSQFGAHIQRHPHLAPQILSPRVTRRSPPFVFNSVVSSQTVRFFCTAFEIFIPRAASVGFY